MSDLKEGAHDILKFMILNSKQNSDKGEVGVGHKHLKFQSPFMDVP